MFVISSSAVEAIIGPFMSRLTSIDPVKDLQTSMNEHDSQPCKFIWTGTPVSNERVGVNVTLRFRLGNGGRLVRSTAGDNLSALNTRV